MVYGWQDGGGGGCGTTGADTNTGAVGAIIVTWFVLWLAVIGMPVINCWLPLGIMQPGTAATGAAEV